MFGYILALVFLVGLICYAATSTGKISDLIDENDDIKATCSKYKELNSNLEKENKLLKEEITTLKAEKKVAKKTKVKSVDDLPKTEKVKKTKK